MENKMFFLLPVVAYSKIQGEGMLIIGWFNKSLIVKLVSN
jgi:hypothetical protein